VVDVNDVNDNGMNWKNLP